jgi:hypothetical protein
MKPLVLVLVVAEEGEEYLVRLPEVLEQTVML